VLQEYAQEWFGLEPGQESPYMLLVAPVQENHRVPIAPDEARMMASDPDLRHRVNVVRSDVPATTHVDYSARVQTVDEQRNPRFHRLLMAFHQLTGCPVLVNTSFNVRGEPIVCSPEDAYRHFQEIFKDQKNLVQNVGPDALPASFQVKLKNPEEFGVVAARLASQPGIDKIRDNRQILKRLFAVIHVFRVGVLAVALIMLISAAALIGNTVRMAVFARRKEIGIMRLVGATNWHIRVPFLIEGLIEGLIGAGGAILGLFIMKVAFIDPLRGQLGFFPLVGTPHIISVIPWLIVLSLIVSSLASLIAMRRFLEV
jgi:hypothetical protein